MIARHLRIKLSFLKEYQNKIVIFVCFASEKCYYGSILLKSVYRSCLIRNELFKGNNCDLIRGSLVSPCSS